MKEWYFHRERGLTMGPIDFEELKARVRQGRILLTDMIFKDGEPGWRMALEYPDLPFPENERRALKSKPWVVLRRKGEGEFVTSGPFGEAEIVAALQAGEISYGDYAWRSGMSEWRRIGSLPSFNRRVEERETPPELPEPPATELLANVVELKRYRPPVEEPPPPETVEGSVVAPPSESDSVSGAGDDEATRIVSSRDLGSDEATRIVSSRDLGSDDATRIVQTEDLKQDSDEATRIVSPEELQPRPEPVPVPLPSQPQDDIVFNEKPKLEEITEPKRAWVDWGIVAGLALVLIGAIFAASRYMSKPPAPEVAPPPQATEPTPAPEKPKAAPSKPVAKSTPPTELRLDVATVSERQIRVSVQTDAGPGYPVYVQIVGLPGQVTEGGAYYQYMKLAGDGGGVKPIDLSGLKLPQGRFIFRVATGDLRKEARVAVGVNEPAYKQTVARLRKAHASSIWQERLQLFKLSQELEKAIAEGVAGKRFNSRPFSALNAVTRSSGGKYLLFEHWWELREILDSARTTPSLALLERTKRVRERLASFSVWK